MLLLLGLAAGLARVGADGLDTVGACGLVVAAGDVHAAAIAPRSARTRTVRLIIRGPPVEKWPERRRRLIGGGRKPTANDRSHSPPTGAERW
ncbi:MAG: hypothetical protein ACJ765_06015 [Chloroflexota bacterium]